MPRVLIVDDEPDILLMLRLNFESEGHEVVTASDGRQALAEIDATDPEIVVLDVMMPVLDGWGVLEALQRVTEAPPVIMVSAKSSGRDIIHAIELGASDYLTKPFDPEALMVAVRALLERTPDEREQHRRAVIADASE